MSSLKERTGTQLYCKLRQDEDDAVSGTGTSLLACGYDFGLRE